MADKRRCPRFGIELAITFGSESHFWTSSATNLSEGGVFIATRELKPIGSEVELTIMLPAPAHPIWLRGEVRWIRQASPNSSAPLGMGIQFRMISEESLRSIAEFLHQRPPLPGYDPPPSGSFPAAFS
jgi:uncharacterized protein (TIGR02266 family)